jgi:hypothetical protein
MENAELIEINVFNEIGKKQYSFLVECVMDSLEFREIIDETLEKGYNGWTCTASLLADELDDTLLLGC